MRNVLKRGRAPLLAATSLVGLIGLTAPSHAQEAAAGAEASDGIADIVVTARRTSESLQSTPVAVTALNAAALEDAQVTLLADIQRAAPSLTASVNGPGGPGNAFLAIRGQTNTGGNSTSDSAVATYMDGVYFARSTAGNLGIFDVSQAEVLRGPQGTLFGRNTTGGALNLTTTQPDGILGGYVRVEAGNYGSLMTDAAATIPLVGEELSLRIAGRYAERDGYFENPVLGTDNTADLDHFYGVRGTLRWDPVGQPIDVTISADYADWEDNGQATALIAYDPGPLTAIFTPAVGAQLAAIIAASNYGVLVGPGGGGTWDQTYGGYDTLDPDVSRPFDDGTSSGISATVNLDLGAWQVKSISAWRRADSNNSLDLDGTPLPVVAFASEYRQEQISQEAQATTSIGDLDLIIGGIYFLEFGFEQSKSTQGPFVGADIGDFDAQSQALYAQANYHFTDRLRGTAGYRYTWDERNLTRRGRSDFTNPNSCTPPIPLTPRGCALPLSADFSYPAWTVGLDYQFSDNLFAYVKSSQASISGGFNTREAPLGNESFEPEETTDVEVGVKVDLFDRRLRTNFAIFNGETTGAQRQASGLRANGSTTQFTQNTGDVEFSGAELEVTVAPWQGMELSGGLAYLDSSYAAGSFVETQVINNASVVVDRSGELVPQAPELNFTLGATQRFTFSSGELSLHADYSFFDDRAISQATAAPGSPAPVLAAYDISNQAGIIESYSLVNARLAFRMNNGLELSLWGKNIGEEEYYTYAFNGLYLPLGIATKNQGEPATYGVGLSYDF